MRVSLTSSPSELTFERGALVLRAFWRISRPAIWLVSVLPFAVGYVLASHRLAPPLDWSHAHRPLLGALAIGPLFWLSALIVNDIHDLPGDRVNARKWDAPLVLGALTLTAARRVAAAAAVLAVVTAAFAGVTVALVTAALVACGWLYSAPPLRLKERPGADVAINAGALGGLTLLAGWATVRPVSVFPWPMLAQGVLVATALYVPTTLVDHDADQLAGFQTVATRLGARRACWLGWWSWCAANAGAVVLCASDTVLPRALLPFLAVAAPLLVVEYAVLIAWPRTGLTVVRGLVVTSVSFFVVNVAFAIVYTQR